MNYWQLQEAKGKLSQVLKRAQTEPQVITLHGKEAGVILSFEEYKRLTSPKDSLINRLRALSPLETELEIERSREPLREIEL